jgi:hypothetical protein
MMELFSKLTKELRIISAEVTACIPIIEDGGPSKEAVEAMPPMVSAQNTSAFLPRKKFSDSFRSPAEAEAKGQALFGNPNALSMLSVAISECAQGRPYRDAHKLSSLVQVHCFDLHKFIQNCPPGAPEWCALRDEFRDGQIFWSASSQVILNMLPSIRVIATNWAIKDASARAAKAKELAAAAENGEAESEVGALFSLSPSMSKNNTGSNKQK